MPRKHGFFLKQWRKHRKLTQDQLAGRCDTTVPTISRWENGQMNFTSGRLGALADALDIEIADLFRDPNRPESRILNLVSGLDEKTKQQAIKLIEALKAA